MRRRQRFGAVAWALLAVSMFASAGCGAMGGPPITSGEGRGLLDGHSLRLIAPDYDGTSESGGFLPALPAAELATVGDIAFVGTIAGFATEPNAIREVETNLPPDFPTGPYVLAVFKDVRVIRPEDGRLVELHLPLAMTVGLARDSIGTVEHSDVVSWLAELPRQGREYLFIGPMLSDLPERCVDTTEAIADNGLFEVRGGDAVDRDGALVPLTSLRPRPFSPAPNTDSAVVFAGRPSVEISANVSMHESAYSVVSANERTRASVVAQRCADAADQIGGPYATRADVLAALTSA